jgi:hypothetical protein
MRVSLESGTATGDQRPALGSRTMVTDAETPASSKGAVARWSLRGLARRMPRPHHSPVQGRSTKHRLRPVDRLSPQLKGDSRRVSKSPRQDRATGCPCIWRRSTPKARGPRPPPRTPIHSVLVSVLVSFVLVRLCSATAMGGPIEHKTYAGNPARKWVRRTRKRVWVKVHRGLKSHRRRRCPVSGHRKPSSPQVRGFLGAVRPPGRQANSNLC